MTLAELKNLLESKIERMQKLSDAVIGKEGEVRSFTEDEQKEYSKLETEAKELRGAVKRAEELKENRSVVATLNAPASPAPRVEIIRADKHNQDGEYRGFGSFGEFLQAVARSSTPGNAMDTRLEELHKSAQTRAVSGHSEGIGADGGFLVQTDFQQTLWQKSKEAASIAPLCEEITISSPSNSLEWVEVVEDSRATGSRNGGVRVYRDKEAGTVSSSKIQLRKDRLQLEKMTAIAYTTEEALQDATALQSLIEPAFASEMAFALDEEIINGDGNGECLGVLKAPCLITVAAEGSQTADTVNHANIRKMRAQMYPSCEPRARWLIGSGVQEQLEIMSFTPASGTSIPVYMPATGISQRGYGTLYSLPVQRSEHASAIGDVGDVIFADFSQYRLIRKGGLAGTASQHVRFIYGEMTFRWTMRVIGKPMWRLPVTRSKGSVTDSPFVTLAAR